MSNNRQDINYLAYDYPENHWSVKPEKEGTGIAYFTYRNKYRYLVKFNPTDSRGYRILVTYIGEFDKPIQSTFNRTYSIAEQKGLAEVLTFMTAIFKRLGIPLVQTAQAGNNSHSFDVSRDTIQIG